LSVASSTTLESVLETLSERADSVGLPLLSGEEAQCAQAEGNKGTLVSPCDAQLIFYFTLASIYVTPILYSVSLLIQPTCIARSIRNLRGHLSNMATRICFHFCLV